MQWNRSKYSVLDVEYREVNKMAKLKHEISFLKCLFILLCLLVSFILVVMGKMFLVGIQNVLIVFVQFSNLTKLNQHPPLPYIQPPSIWGIIILWLKQLWSSSNIDNIFPIIYWHNLWSQRGPHPSSLQSGTLKVLQVKNAGQI